MRGRTTTLTVMTAAVMLAALGAGCGRREAPAPGPVTMTPAEQEKWEIALVEARIEKNEKFESDPETPLPAAALDGFEGLDYYFPDASLRYVVPLAEAAKPDTVVLTRRKGRQDRYVRRGTVTFRHDDHDYTLGVFGPADTTSGDFLWLPFYDATNDDTTYPGGRYLDLERTDDGTVVLDFNYAYNPLCDYDHERFDCTLPPAENRLPFRVEAGEKRFRPAAGAAAAGEADQGGEGAAAAAPAGG